MVLPPLHLIIRLFLAAILGGLVGYEREIHGRPAGLRTHILVCLGSALIMTVSVYGFTDDVFSSLTPDPARIAAQVVSGIGFIGAGTILRQGANIRGLTTAASLWVVAAVGLAVGIGYYVGAIITTLFVLLSLYVLSGVEKSVVRKSSQVELVISAVDQPGLLGNVGSVLGQRGVNITKIDMKEKEYQETYKTEIVTIEFFLQISKGIKIDDLMEEIMLQKGVLEVSWNGRNIFQSP